MKNKILTILLLSQTIILFGMEPDLPINVDPEIVVDMINKADRNYKIFSGQKSVIIEVNGRARLDLSRDMEKHPRTAQFYHAKRLYLSVQDQEGNIPLKIGLRLFPRTGFFISLEGYYLPENAEKNIKFSKSKKTSFLINLYLKGKNLQDTFIDETVIEY
jgi:hypothetical protein